ncbi:MAG: hypothetical protein A2Y98_01880 [Candidatus Portnoybacteria bacterium RBG_19FT_COMBO_36_7]|uniref:PD-(D/E)XK endonuclease-like domain-containing protein n=1 Tax=Candidatus Portnoybacteria bacterium RBG_19FT_COMBO_36_7 TaxID=1801992 RepID=A0A1G2F7B2_9BACT|nr:MAG: hypothetical protein A2Y98_01880 [Candidatus Portnoybacteria bacterium RBG_19FT_COMBO_36_7]
MAEETGQSKTIFLSPSKLNLFQECPLCFWLQEVKGIHRPRGIFPSLPSGMDGVIKKYFDRYRLTGELPPETRRVLQGKLLDDQALMKKWRNWRTGLRYSDKKMNAVLVGALDDCLLDDGFYVPIDYKTRGYDLKGDSMVFYQTQLDCYTFLLESGGYKHLNLAYLVYYIPEEVSENGQVKFRVEPHKVETNPHRGYQIFAKAVKVLRGSRPSSHSGCKYCSWGNDFSNFQ